MLVVAAVVVEDRGVLIARRSEGRLAGFWEFPGGKVETGESPEQALVREIREELSVESTVIGFFTESEHQGTAGMIRLVFFRCRLHGEPVAGDSHDAIAWVPLQGLGAYRLAPADAGAVRKLQEEYDVA